MGIIVVFGICLFIIPGIYLALRLQFFTAFIVEEDTGIIESLKRSWEITRGQGMYPNAKMQEIMQLIKLITIVPTMDFCIGMAKALSVKEIIVIPINKPAKTHI